MKQLVVRLKQAAGWWRSADAGTRTALTAAGSTVSNLLLGGVKLVLGLVLFSPWFIINTVYYILLGVARGFALRQCTTELQKTAYAQTERRARQAAACKRGGLFLLLLGVCYLLISVRMFFRQETVVYSSYTVFAVVLMTIGKLYSSIIGLLAHSRATEPIFALLRKYSLADACVSLVSVRCALLMLTKAPNAVQNSALFGMLTSGMLLALSAVTLWNKRR